MLWRYPLERYKKIAQPPILYTKILVDPTVSQVKVVPSDLASASQPAQL
jgi:hypothetical protein